MKKFWQSKSHAFTITAIPMLSYALLNIQDFGFSVHVATWLGFILTGVVMVGNAWIRQVTTKAIE